MPDEHEEYNPLDYGNLTRNCVEELMKRGPYPLPPEREFIGAGVYAIFYDGDFPLYSQIRSPDSTYPIYVGKAVPAGARTGKKAADGSRPGKPLFSRLQEHAESIQRAHNLRIEHFRCRYLVVTPLWITMAERFLIEDFQPLWNIALDGFGNHDPGRRRAGGLISWWDLFHPGRSDTWTGKPSATVVKPRRKRDRKGLSAEVIEETITRTVDQARDLVVAYLEASPEQRKRMAREAVAREEEQEARAINGTTTGEVGTDED
jgi:hypothetical protein